MSMTCRGLVMVVCLMAFRGPAPAGARQEEKPAEPAKADRLPSYPIEQAATEFVGQYGRMDLLEDKTFIEALVKLAGSDLSPAAKADAFILMQERIGWRFVGVARVFPNTAYPQTQSMILSTYFTYQEAMPKGLDVAPLLEFAAKTRNDHPLRASNAYLLAAILNHEAAKKAVVDAIDLAAIEAAPVPAIDLHHIALASSLSRDLEGVRKLLALLPKIKGEECQEDVVIATIIYQDETLRDDLEKFARDLFPGRLDQTLKTTLLALANQGPPDHFTSFYKSLGEQTKDEKAIDWLRENWDAEVRRGEDGPTKDRSALKVWDGFHLTLEKEGASVHDSTGKFRAWISFE